MTSRASHSGDVRVRLGGVDIGLYRWGAVPTGKHIQRDILCARFKAAKLGRQLFEIRFERRIGAKRGRTPRLWIDNVGMWLTTGPSFCFRGDRKPPAAGPRRPTSLELAGQAASAFVVLMSPRSTNGIKVPGFGGIFALDVTSTLPFFSGAIPANGVYKQALTIPASLAPPPRHPDLVPTPRPQPEQTPRLRHPPRQRLAALSAPLPLPLPLDETKRTGWSLREREAVVRRVSAYPEPDEHGLAVLGEHPRNRAMTLVHSNDIHGQGRRTPSLQRAILASQHPVVRVFAEDPSHRPCQPSSAHPQAELRVAP